MAISTNGSRPARPDDFVREALEIAPPLVVTPDPDKDFGMYAKMDEAFLGLHEHLDDLRRNQGRLAYTAQNTLSDLSKSAIIAAFNGNDEDVAYFELAMERLASGFDEATADGEIADNANRFSRTQWQELMEAYLFARIWPVIVGESDEVTTLTSWSDFDGNVQAYLYGFLDVVSELSKSVTEKLSDPDMTIEEEFAIYERYLAIADSIVLRLSQERHVPGYVISNGYGRWMSYATKLRTAYGTIGHVRREYNLRRSMQRMLAAKTTF